MSVSVDEVDDFRTAVAGLEIDWLRTDRGWGPARMTASFGSGVAVSVGGLDFSTLMTTQVPSDMIGLQFVLAAPSGLRWNGQEAADGDVRFYRPGTPVAGQVPAGSRAVTVVAEMAQVARVATALGAPVPWEAQNDGPMKRTPQVRTLATSLRMLSEKPGLVERATTSALLTEDLVRAFTSQPGVRHTVRRGLDRREVVRTCLDYVESTGANQPTMSELCSAAFVSETLLRSAFVEMLGVPPMKFFQLRVLSMLRNRLLEGDPASTSVTWAAASLGLTQLGRVAGRYQALFGETPRETLRTPGSRRVTARTIL